MRKESQVEDEEQEQDEEEEKEEQKLAGPTSGAVLAHATCHGGGGDGLALPQPVEGAVPPGGPTRWRPHPAAAAVPPQRLAIAASEVVLALMGQGTVIPPTSQEGH